LNNPEDKQNPARQIGVYITIPFVLAVPPILGWFIGSWLDQILKTEPYLMYLFLVLGFVAGFRELYRIIKKFGNNGT